MLITLSNLCSFAKPSSFLLAQQPKAFGGMDGFIPGARGSIMLDIVVLAMFAVVPVLLASVYLAKFRGKFQLHKQLQLGLAIVLGLAVAAFEVDMQFLTEWELRAEPSPYFETANKWSCPAGISLLIHLCFAIPTLVIWIGVVVAALRHFAHPPAPGAHSRSHAFWGMLGVGGMVLTSVTGWIFYYLAFVAA